MRWSLRLAALAAALVLASCGQVGTSEETADMASPDVRPGAAPGVAFRFAYDFRLADDRIDEVQEAHAAECEA